jgi:hypothetical protein
VLDASEVVSRRSALPSQGLQRMRIQVREDGLAIDQVVLSAVKYLNASPGALRNDSTILSK